MYTVDTALDSLKKYDIRETDILQWERELRLDIPVDEYGRKQYSPHHINLFKNIKKHIALGRTMDEIKRIINLPPLTESKPQPQPSAQAQRAGYQSAPRHITAPQTSEIELTPPSAMNASAPQASVPQAPAAQAKVINKNPYSSVPKRPPVANAQPSGGAANVVNLVQRLTREKDQLYKKLMDTEKLNSHLYSANNLYNKKVREMTRQIHFLRENLQENENFKLLDDKDKLHKELIAAEKKLQYRQDEIQNLQRETEVLRSQIRQQEGRINALSTSFDPSKFCGDWMETGHLVEVLYDNFGVNIEPERVRLFRISEPPSRMYGKSAVIATSYQYETNSLWKRNESLSVTYVDQETLEGELTAEYVLDGVPVAKALYRVTCRRNQ